MEASSVQFDQLVQQLREIIGGTLQGAEAVAAMRTAHETIEHLSNGLNRAEQVLAYGAEGKPRISLFAPSWFPTIGLRWETATGAQSAAVTSD